MQHRIANYHFQMSISRVAVPAGKPVPYVVPSYQGERLNIPGTKSTIRVLASAKETEGAMNVFHMDGVLGDPVGFHHHEEAHDIFICTKGYMKVWAGDQCRLLGPGDMCSVPPVSCIDHNRHFSIRTSNNFTDRKSFTVRNLSVHGMRPSASSPLENGLISFASCQRHIAGSWLINLTIVTPSNT